MRRRAGVVVSEALALSAVICVGIAAVLLAATPAFFGAVASLSPDMIATATEYVRWRAVGLPFAIGYSVMQACAPSATPVHAPPGPACARRSEVLSGQSHDSFSHRAGSNHAVHRTICHWPLVLSLALSVRAPLTSIVCCKSRCTAIANGDTTCFPWVLRYHRAIHSRTVSFSPSHSPPHKSRQWPKSQIHTQLAGGGVGRLSFYLFMGRPLWLGHAVLLVLLTGGKLFRGATCLLVTAAHTLSASHSSTPAPPCCRCFLACQAPRIPMLATVAAGVVNLAGDLLLCQVFNFGAAGAAAATSGAPPPPPAPPPSPPRQAASLGLGPICCTLSIPDIQLCCRATPTITDPLQQPML